MDQFQKDFPAGEQLQAEVISMVSVIFSICTTSRTCYAES